MVKCIKRKMILQKNRENIKKCLQSKRKYDIKIISVFDIKFQIMKYKECESGDALQKNKEEQE